MGMASYFEEEDIEVKDMEGLKVFLENFKKKFPKEDYLCNIIKPDKNKGEIVSFGDWDDWKLISYWYDHVCVFLHCVAKYLEGYVKWRFETDDETGAVNFEDGKARLELGKMSYSDHEPLSLVRTNTKEFDEFLLVEEI